MTEEDLSVSINQKGIISVTINGKDIIPLEISGDY